MRNPSRKAQGVCDRFLEEPGWLFYAGLGVFKAVWSQESLGPRGLVLTGCRV